MFLVAEDGTVEYANQRAVDVFGHDADDWPGKSIDDLLPDRLREAHAGHRADFAEDPRPRPMGREMDLRALRADGTEFPVEVSLSPIQVGERTLVAAAVRDVTEVRRLQRQLKAALNTARLRSKDMEAFAARAAHDLRSPLAGLRLGMNVLHEYCAEGPREASEWIGRLEESAAQLANMVDGLLEMSRLEEQELAAEPVDLAGVVDRVIDLLGPDIEEAAAQVAWSDLPTVGGDERLLGHLLMNLISNAVHYRSEEAPRIRVEGRSAGGVVKVEVRDNGLGLPEHAHDAVFEPLSRFHADVPGSGIGLALCRRIVDHHGGTIGFEPGPDGGSVFWFTLPTDETGGAMDPRGVDGA